MPLSPALKQTISRSSNDANVHRHAPTPDRPGVVAALALLRGYKLLISPFFAGSCRFEPSCSEYMAESIRVRGLLSGVWLGLKRLSRCRPFGGYGIDPVQRP